jgi:hypothetical protein
MKTLMSLFLFATLSAGFTGCAYYERDRYVPVYGSYDYRYQSYYPERHYDSKWDYYRHFNGIDG